MVLQCSKPGDIGSFSEMTIKIGSICSILEDEVRNRTKFENRRVLVPVVLYYSKVLVLHCNQVHLIYYIGSNCYPAPRLSPSPCPPSSWPPPPSYTWSSGSSTGELQDSGSTPLYRHHTVHHINIYRIPKWLPRRKIGYTCMINTVCDTSSHKAGNCPSIVTFLAL